VTDPATIPLAFERLPVAEMQRPRRRLPGDHAAAPQRPQPSAATRSPSTSSATAIQAAGTAPSGAHMQPWTFVLVTDPALKHADPRVAAEAEERETYDHRMSDEWRAALAPLGTDWHKPFLEDAPALIVLFRQDHGAHPRRRAPQALLRAGELSASPSAFSSPPSTTPASRP
jgi:iodotyrosine deiodinase